MNFSFGANMAGFHWDSHILYSMYIIFSTRGKINFEFKKGVGIAIKSKETSR